MLLQMAFILALLLSILGLLIWHFYQKKEMSSIHKQNILDLEKDISKNRHQINFRNTYLNRYDFLKFNLNEALAVQLEIPLSV